MKLKNWEEKLKRKYLVYKANRYKFDFQQYETIIVQIKLTLLDNLTDFNDRSRPKTAEGKNNKNTYKSAHDLFEGGELTLKAFRSGI